MCQGHVLGGCYRLFEIPKNEHQMRSWTSGCEEGVSRFLYALSALMLYALTFGTNAGYLIVIFAPMFPCGLTCPGDC